MCNWWSAWILSGVWAPMLTTPLRLGGGRGARNLFAKQRRKGLPAGKQEGSRVALNVYHDSH